MAAEQEKFQDWLLTQSPEEILNHTFEYSTREDIVLLMDDIRLSNDDLKILLSSPTPLADVYKILSNTDTTALTPCPTTSSWLIASVSRTRTG